MALVANYQLTHSEQYVIENTLGKDSWSSLCFSAYSTERNARLSIVNSDLRFG